MDIDYQHQFGAYLRYTILPLNLEYGALNSEYLLLA